ncbi:MAG: hypothetical protein LZF60_140173 [Nitrospira sp.]|nr:MAG: hypothetical protein LZF60_140173 [Nitrospira sp.]
MNRQATPVGTLLLEDLTAILLACVSDAEGYG